MTPVEVFTVLAFPGLETNVKHWNDVPLIDLSTTGMTMPLGLLEA